MENVNVTDGTGTRRSSLSTLRAFRPRATGVISGSYGGGHIDGHPLPLPIFDPTQDVTPVRMT